MQRAAATPREERQELGEQQQQAKKNNRRNGIVLEILYTHRTFEKTPIIYYIAQRAKKSTYEKRGRPFKISL